MNNWDTLDQVPWGELQHAYGAAIDTPIHLRNLASTEPGIRANAHTKLERSIVHQGSVYEAAIYTIPYLVDLLQSDEVEEKENILSLLSDIACGGSWHDAHKNLPSLVDSTTVDYQQQLDEETRSVAKIRSNFKTHIEAFLACLQSDSLEIFHGTVALLTNFADMDADSFQWIVSLAESTKSSTKKADLLLLLAHLNAQKSEEILRKSFASNPAQLVKFASAIGLGKIETDFSTALADYLSTILDDNDKDFIKQYNSLGASFGYWFDAAQSFVLTNKLNADKVVMTYTDAVEESSYCTDEQLYALLLVAFYRNDSIDITSPSSIQQRAVYAVAQKAFPRPRTAYSNARNVLQNFGLPHSRAGIDDYLGFPNEAEIGFEQAYQDATPKSYKWFHWIHAVDAWYYALVNKVTSAVRRKFLRR